MLLAVLAQTSTTLAGFPTEPVENPASTQASLVFFAVMAIIIGGAVILYLRNRRRPTDAP